MEQEVRLNVKRKPEVDVLLSDLKNLDDNQLNYVLGVIDGTNAQLARQARLATNIPQ